MNAEAAERDADRALLAARAAVREAREHVKKIEREAEEEARLAKIKQKQAGDLGKRGKQLGRKCQILLGSLEYANMISYRSWCDLSRKPHLIYSAYHLKRLWRALYTHGLLCIDDTMNV